MNPAFSVSDFVAIFNQTLEYAYPVVTIVGELSNFRVSKGKWVYFDLKDEQASVRFFGTIYAMPGPLEDGMVVQVTGSPRLHQTFGFSITAKTIVPVGEGSIKKAVDLLKIKLEKEGLFSEQRKRFLPFPPDRIGLVTSGESAAFKDFTKILDARWGGVEIFHADVQVQGEAAPSQIIEAIARLNMMDVLDVIVVTRGGGSSDDLQAFNNELVVRAIAASRVPTIVAIGHEVDVSLSELVADKRASTPSNAAELLVPDIESVNRQNISDIEKCMQNITHILKNEKNYLVDSITTINNRIEVKINEQQQYIDSVKQLLSSYDPERILSRGYALVRKSGKHITSVTELAVGDSFDVAFKDGNAFAEVKTIKFRE